MILRAAAFVVAVAILATPALAQMDEGALPDFVDDVEGAKSCWSRSYTDQHLAEHPDQLVTDMYFGMQFIEYPESQQWPDGRHQYHYQLKVKQRGGDHEAEAIGSCFAAEDGRISCDVECDGGGVYVSKRDDGSVLVDLETTGFIRLLTCGAEGQRVVLRPGKDDKTFLLSPLPADQCGEIGVLFERLEEGID